jgi:uncharacterized membrane-anchored protein YhcB (DUF1043 family)
MAETEVESILREIRERVLAQQRAGQDVAAAGTAIGNAGNGASDARAAPSGHSETAPAESLALISSYLTTTARAWDRLPPLVSNRSGLTARLELWLKRRLRAGTRWFTWEQVNFNAAAHHTLHDMLPLLSAYEQELEKLRARSDETEARRTELEEQQTDLTTQLAQIRAELETQRRAIEAHRIQVEARLADLVRELRQGNERLQDEQRVCFRQLALETSEAAVLEDRARRKTEALLEELKRRVEQLEK